MGLLLAVASELPYSGYIQLIVLAYVWRLINKSANNNFVALFNQGLVFGLGYFILALWWIYISLHDVGGISSLLSTFAVFALASLMAIYFGLAIGLGFFISNPFWRALGLPAAWVISEYLRGQLFTGFPWMGLAESQVHGPFATIAPYFGGLACVFLLVWASWQISFLRIRNTLGALVVIAFTQAMGLWQFTSPIGEPISVRLIQGNFEQSLKFNPEEIRRQIDFYRNAIIKTPADLIIVPETAFPWPEPDLPDQSLKTIQDFANQSGSQILLGLIGKIPQGINTFQYSNRVTGFTKDQTPYHYDKYHLVPFGEFIPPGFQWFVNAFKVPMSNFARGAITQPPFPVLGKNQDTSKARYAAISICYEDIFGNEIASRLRQSQNPVNLLINVTNLAWFGQSQAPMQQLRLSQLRSIETGLPSLRATNTGITAIIDYRGKVQVQLDQFVQGELSAAVQPYTGKTLYVIWGNWPILIFSLLVLLVAFIRARK
jgi:apolipoprotein N-acyltransferase